MKQWCILILTFIMVSVCCVAVAGKITSLDSFNYDATDWFASNENRAYVAAALYGEAEESFREEVGIPARVLIGKGMMNDGTTEYLVLDYVSSSGQYYYVSFYPVGTPLDTYPHAIYMSSGTPTGSFGSEQYNPIYIITESEFSSAYTKWQNDDHSGEPEDSPYLFNFIGHNSSSTVSFSLPARGYIDLTLNKAYINSLTPYGYYYIKVFKESNQIFYIDSIKYREKTKENYVIGLAPGDYSIEFTPKGFYPSKDTLRTQITCQFFTDNFCEVEPNNSMGKATALKHNLLYTGYIGEESDGQDYYSFSLKAGIHYQIRFPGLEALKATTAMIHVLDSSGKRRYETLYETADYFYYDFTPEQDGTYYIKIYNYSGSNYGVVGYRLGVFEEIDLTTMDTLYLPQQLSVIKADAFKGGDFEAVVIPDSCTRIGSKAFAECENLRYVEMPASLTDIAADAFEMQNGIQIERR